MAHLSAALASILGICGSLGKDNKRLKNPDFLKIVLKCERPFHEIFSVQMDLFNRTWKEMRASDDDLEKVINIVTEQLQKALLTNPESIEELNNILQKKFSYFQMRKIWEQECIEDEDLELSSKSIQLLKSRLKSGIEQLVLQRQKNFLKNDAKFLRLDPSGKFNLSKDQHYQVWRLESNERYISFCDCSHSSFSSQFSINLDVSARQKFPISYITRIVSGMELGSYVIQCFGSKVSKKDLQSFLNRGMCLMLSDYSCGSIFLYAVEDTDLNGWLNGLNALCFPMETVSNSYVREKVEQLLSIEAKVAMLDLPPGLIVHDLPDPQPPSEFSWLPKQFQPQTSR